MKQEIELQIMPSGNIAVYRGNEFISTEQLTEEEKEFIVECVHKELGWTRPAFEVDGSIGSPDYERGFKHGRDFQAELFAKSTDTDKVIAYLVHQKGYPISTNGEIMSYEETFELVKNAVEYSKNQEREN